MEEARKIKKGRRIEERIGYIRDRGGGRKKEEGGKWERGWDR